METLGRWALFVIMSIAWIVYGIWVWRWRGFDSVAGEYRLWGWVLRALFILGVAVLIMLAANDVLPMIRSGG